VLNRSLYIKTLLKTIFVSRVVNTGRDFRFAPQTWPGSEIYLSPKNTGPKSPIVKSSQVYFIATFKMRKRKQRKTIQSP